MAKRTHTRSTGERISTRPLRRGDWKTLARLFGDNGACGGCWCMWWRVEHGGKSWEAAKGATNRERLRRLVASEKIHAVLAFAGDEAVGWCSFGPRPSFARLAHARVLRRELPAEEAAGVWSIVCFFIPARWRGRGVATQLIAAASERALELGARAIEGYPVVPRTGAQMPAAFAWTGVPKLFERAGYARLARPPGMRPIYLRSQAAPLARATGDVMNPLICVALVAGLSQATTASQPLEPTVTFLTLLEELCDPDRLARLPEPACSWHQRSSAAHGDGHASVLLDVDGPGALVSLESAAPAGTLRVYVDGVEAPVLECPLDALLRGQGPVAAPLAEAGARGGVLHLPIPYALHCKLTCDAQAPPPYHVEYRTYASGTRVASLRAQDLATHARELARAAHKWQRPEDERGDTSFTYSLARQVPEGALLCSAPKDAAGPHAITGMQFKVEAPDLTRALRELVVRMRFDGEETVACPFGDLFGAAPGLNAFRSVPISVRADGVFNCRWTMPYRERFELWIENHGSPDTHVAGSLRTQAWAWDDRSLYFHARWRRSGPISTRPIRDIERIAIEGRGLFVGATLSIANPTSRWWGGGDEQFDIDAQTPPARWSAGTSDECDDDGCIEAPRDGALIVRARRDGPGHFGWTSRARWRALDAIPFERSLRYAVELAHHKELDVELCSAQFYYARPGARDDAPAIGKGELTLPDIAARLPRIAGALEAEALPVLACTSGVTYRRQVLEDIEGGTCSGLEQLAVHAAGAGQSIELLVPIAHPGRRELVLYLTKSSAYGALRFYVDGRTASPVFDAFDASSERLAIAPALALGSFELGPQARLRVETVDRSPPSPAAQFSFGIDCVVVR